MAVRELGNPLGNPLGLARAASSLAKKDGLGCYATRNSMLRVIAGSLQEGDSFVTQSPDGLFLIKEGRPVTSFRSSSVTLAAQLAGFGGGVVLLGATAYDAVSGDCLWSKSYTGYVVKFSHVDEAGCCHVIWGLQTATTELIYTAIDKSGMLVARSRFYNYNKYPRITGLVVDVSANRIYVFTQANSTYGSSLLVVDIVNGELVKVNSIANAQEFPSTVYFPVIDQYGNLHTQEGKNSTSTNIVVLNPTITTIKSKQTLSYGVSSVNIDGVFISLDTANSKGYASVSSGSNTFCMEYTYDASGITSVICAFRIITSSSSNGYPAFYVVATGGGSFVGTLGALVPMEYGTMQAAAEHFGYATTALSVTSVGEYTAYIAEDMGVLLQSSDLLVDEPKIDGVKQVGAGGIYVDGKNILVSTY